MNPTIELIIRNKEIHFRKKDNLTTGQQKNCIKLNFEGEGWNKSNGLSVEAIFRVDDFSLPVSINSDVIEIPFEICKIDFLGRVVYIGFRGTKTEITESGKIQTVYSTPYFRLGVLEQGAVAGDIKPGEAVIAPYDEAKELAKAWAIGPNQPDETPSETNNAKYWSEQSKKNVQDLGHYAEEASASAAAASESATEANNILTSVNNKASEVENMKNMVEENKNATVLAKDEAVKAKNAIVNMKVEAVSLGAGEEATISKLTADDVIKLIFGLPTGATGAPGEDAPKITGINIRQSDFHLIVTLSDGSTYDAGYCRGSAGAGSGDMLMSTYDTHGKNTDIFDYVDNKISKIPTPDVSAQISKHNTDSNAHQDIRDSIPTKTSQLTNDSNFLTEHQNLDNYALKTELDNVLPKSAIVAGILEGDEEGNIIGLEKTEVSLINLDSYIDTKIQAAIQNTWEASY